MSLSFVNQRRFLCLAFAFLFLSASLSVTADEKLERVRLQLKWFHQFQFAGFYAAKAKGFYTAEGLEVEIIQRDPKVNTVDNIVARDAEFGVSDSSIILHRLRGNPVVAIAAVFQHSPTVFLTRKDSEIIGPLELKGRRIMMQRSHDDAALAAMFHIMGIKKKDLILIPHTFEDNVLLNNHVDAMSAYVTDQPYFYKSRGVDVNIINPLSYGVDFYGDIIFTHEEIARNNPELVKRFTRASLKGWDYALKNKEEIVQLIFSAYPTGKSLDHLRYEAVETEKMVMPNLVKIGYLNPQRFQWIADIYRQEGFAPADSNLKGFHIDEYNSLQDNAFKDLGRWFTVISITLTTIILLLMIVSYRLKAVVRKRTLELQETRDALQRYVNIVDKHVISLTADYTGHITAASEAFCKISEFENPLEVTGKDFQFLHHPNSDPDVYRQMLNQIKKGKSWSGQLKSMSKTGKIFWTAAHVEPNYDSKHKFIGFTSIHQDITDAIRVEQLSKTDSLTQLNNRMNLDSALIKETARANRFTRPLSVIMLDIDHFKEINDTYGHTHGDRVLMHVANLLKQGVRESDMVGRWGGEEFMILCPETDLKGAVTLAEKIREQIAESQFVGGIRTTCSFGVTQVETNELPEALTERVDCLLYQAKSKGRNRVEHEEPSTLECLPQEEKESTPDDA
ncbi:ABC transporter substrate-binding protein [Pleionea sp. CnH1-48]|uniref:ABC transporter substrate-binding protein n=1 Tax=Pleionea sp. CnH1-48 TaxID=2954494 RepID=UPI002096FA93|nr:ABC transporter substrate-binding protein [Pleionea sp. CnH1-48]MCO7227229.1 ABC transporter substrate-binding protein [Pleionea sp. CnH1-48]